MTLAKIVAKVEATGDPVAVTRSGKRVAMVVGIDQFMEMHAALKEKTAENRAFLGRVEGAGVDGTAVAAPATGNPVPDAHPSTPEDAVNDVWLSGAQLVAEHQGDWNAFYADPLVSDEQRGAGSQ